MYDLPAATIDAVYGAGIEAIHAGVDWISCTLSADAPGYDMWALKCVHAVKEVGRQGNDVQAYSRNGYDGYGAGGCFCGVRYDGSYLQLSGHFAGDLLDSIIRDDLHISRIDIQTTVRYRAYAAGVGREVYRIASDANGALPKSRQRRIWYITGNDGGWTTYIGAPTSEQRGKLYNKAVQSGKPEYERTWRWEVTAKNEYATAWYKQVIAVNEGRPMLCARIVSTWFGLRGCQPEWSAYIPVITMPLIKEVPSDADKRLKWIETQVKPAIDWLIANGYGKRVSELLEVSDWGN